MNRWGASYRQVFAYHSFRNYWVGFSLSYLGDTISRVALTWFVYESTHSPEALGLLSLFYTGPVILGGLVAGWLLDRFDRRRVMMADSLLRAAIFMLIPILNAAGMLALWHVYAVAAVYGFLMMISLAGGPSLVPSLIATLPGSIAGVLLTRFVSRTVFDGIFAVLLIALAVFVVLAHEDEPTSAPEGGGWGHVLRRLTDASGADYRYRVNVPLGIGISLLVGLASSFLGIGGGVIHVPALVGVLGFPAHIATATSHFVLAIMASAGTVTHVVSGDLDGLYGETAILGAGAIVGAQIGARLSTRVHGVVIIRVLAISLMFVGARLGLQALTGG